MGSDIRAAFFDIDGTLTSFVTHVVPQSTIDALHALQENGVKVFICSGRAPSYMGVVLDTIPVRFDGIVGLNGQYCTTRDGLSYQHPIDQADVEIITSWLEEHTDVIANYAESDYGYFNRTNATLESTWNSLGKTAPKIDICDPLQRIGDHRTFQISPYVDEATEAEIAGMCGNVRGVRWHPAFTDLIPADGGKAAGMRVCLSISAGRRTTRSRSATAATMLTCCGSRESAWLWATRPTSRSRWPITSPIMSMTPASRTR